MREKQLLYISKADEGVIEQYKIEAEILGLTLTEYLLIQVIKELEQMPVGCGE